MPEKHFYFSMGAVVGSMICGVIAKYRHAWKKNQSFIQWLYRKEPHWFLYFPALIFMVACWGLVPDVIHALGLLPKDVTRSGIFDIFFFHSTFEYIESTMPEIDRYLNWLGEFLLLFVALGVMAYYVRQIKGALARG